MSADPIGTTVACAPSSLWIEELSDAARRSDPEDPVAEAAETAQLENRYRRDRQRVGGVPHCCIDGADEIAPGAGGANRRAVRSDGRGEAAAAGSALSRLVA